MNFVDEIKRELKYIDNIKSNRPQSQIELMQINWNEPK